MKRKQTHKHDRSENSGFMGAGEIIYTGFVLILLCFFIMLSSFASMDKAKVTQFARSFSDAVKITSGGLHFESGKTILNKSPEIVGKDSTMALIFNNIKKQIQSLGLTKDVNVKITGKGLVLTLSDTVLFELGKADISKNAIVLLNKIGRIISKTPCDVRIEGHTDDFPIHNEKYPSNWELSTTRAVNVLRYFIEKANVSAQKLSAVGFGEYHPVAPNNFSANRAKNRRVEIIFIKK